MMTVLFLPLKANLVLHARKTNVSNKQEDLITCRLFISITIMYTKSCRIIRYLHILYGSRSYLKETLSFYANECICIFETLIWRQPVLLPTRWLNARELSLLLRLITKCIRTSIVIVAMPTRRIMKINYRTVFSEKYKKE